MTQPSIVSPALVLAVSLISACAPAPGGNAAAPDGAPTANEPSGELLGRWRIVSLDGEPLASPGLSDAGEPRIPSLTFTGETYGGTVGCNGFGGIGFVEDGRLFTAPGPQTQMACGSLTAREEAATALLAAAPEVTFTGPGAAQLRGGGHSLVLAQETATPPNDDGGMVAPFDLTGTVWNIWAIDGQHLSPRTQRDRRPLRFEAGYWSGTAACATLGGAWRQEGDHIIGVEEIETTEQLCRPDEAAIDSGLAAVMRAKPRLTGGPNGELLLGGGGHWLIAEAVRDSQN